MARNLQTIARDLKSASNLIVNFTFPKISPSEESDFDFLRSATICVDGSLVNIYYTKSDYNSHFFETVQIIGEYSPFIPFLVVLKVGKVFLLAVLFRNSWMKQILWLKLLINAELLF